MLVAPRDFDAAQAVLAGLGHTDLAAQFPDDEWLWHERSWRHEGTPALTVDLHRGFAGAGDAEELVRLLFAEAEPLTLSGGVVRVPGPIGCALLVALHAAAPGRGRKALTDLDVALSQLSESVWRDAAAWAATARATEAFSAGLRRSEAGAELAERLGAAGSTSLLDRLAQRLDLVLLRRSWRALRDTPGGAERARYLARRLVPSPAFLRLGSSVARRGPLGLAAAYALRPLRLLVPAPRPDRQLRLDPRRWTPATVTAAAWTLAALRRVRQDLAAGPLDAVRVPPAPRLAPTTEPTVRRTPARRRASCLERSLVLQRWWAAQGVPVDLVVGVTAPADGFRAHAWLEREHDAEHSHASMAALLTRPTPDDWLPVSRA